jgi:hypothetical protein
MPARTEAAAPRPARRAAVAGVLSRLRPAVVAGVLLLAACAPPYRVLVLQPGFDGTRIHRMQGNVLGGGARVAPQVELNLERVDAPEQAPQLFALLEYSGSDWLAIPQGPSLTLVVDGDTMRLEGPGSAPHRTVLHGHTAYELARYPIEPEQAQRLAAGSAGGLVVRGGAGSVRRSLTERNFANLRAFAERHVAPLAAAAAER